MLHGSSKRRSATKVTDRLGAGTRAARRAGHRRCGAGSKQESRDYLLSLSIPSTTAILAQAALRFFWKALTFSLFGSFVKATREFA